MKFTFASQTDSGRVRENNEDAVAFDEATQLCVLADGMGGYNAGEVASGMAVDLVLSDFRCRLAEINAAGIKTHISQAIEKSVEEANQKVFMAALNNPAYAGMGTTLVVGLFKEDRLFLGHIGDSRCYRLRRNRISQLTRDHTLLQEQLDGGLLTLKQAKASPHRNLLTRALGVQSQIVTEMSEHKVEPGDVYLMCSDGLTDMVGPGKIEKLLGLKISPNQRAQRLIQAANENGGRDNITVLLINVEATSPRTGLVTRLLKKMRLITHNK